MAIEDKKILHINDALSAISNGQLAVELVADTELGFKVWGGKDYDGAVVKFLAKDKAAKILSLTITNLSVSGIMRNDASGVVSGGLMTLAELNAFISDATLGDVTSFQKTFDTRGAGKHVTGSASAGGGTVSSNIPLGIVAGTASALRIKANGNTIDSTIEFFTDAGLTDQIYLASNKNCYASPYFVDRTPWACFSFDNDLGVNGLYYRITNDGVNASTYDIELFGLGKE